MRRDEAVAKRAREAELRVRQIGRAHRRSLGAAVQSPAADTPSRMIRRHAVSIDAVTLEESGGDALALPQQREQHMCGVYVTVPESE